MLTENDKNLIKELGRFPIDYWDFKEEETKEYTHGIHNYPAVMVAPISRNIIKLMKSYTTINSLLDPFSGSGTVLVEGMLANIPNIAGNDINPLALFISQAKTKILDLKELNKEIENLKGRLNNKEKLYRKNIENIDNDLKKQYNLNFTSKDNWGSNAYEYLQKYCNENKINLNIPNFKNIGYWFKPKVIISLSIIKEEVLKIKNLDIRNYILVSFSESIRLVSNRRNGEFKLFRMQSEKVEQFSPNVFYEFFKIVDRNKEKMQEFIDKVGDNKSTVKIFSDNACELNNVPNNEYDLIITSPPYGDSRTTVAYGEYSRLSLQWLNLYELTDKEILRVDKTLMGGAKFNKGFEMNLKSETLKKSLDVIKELDSKRAGDVYSFYKDLDSAIEKISLKTKKGGYQFWVVGNRTVKNELLKTDEIISELAEQYNLETIYTINRNIPNKVMPSLNSPTNEIGKKVTTMTMEHIVILKKV